MASHTKAQSEPAPQAPPKSVPGRQRHRQKRRRPPVETDGARALQRCGCRGLGEFSGRPFPLAMAGMARHALRGRDSLGLLPGSFSVCLLTVLHRGDTVNITSINQAWLRMQPVGAKHPVEPVRRRACPRCHAFVDWQAADPAFSATAEYRICPECDGAVFIGWRSAEPSAPLGPLAPEVR